MKKILLFSAVICCAMHYANGQSIAGTNFYGNNNFLKGFGAVSSAHQNVGMQLSNVIAFAFTTTGNPTGNVVNIPFSSVTDYTDGVTSPEQQLKVESNNNFNISVNTSTPDFTYIGNANPAPKVSVNEVLALRVTTNGTSGSVSPSFNKVSGSLSSVAQNLVLGGSAGGNQTFSIQYKTTPGLGYPSGVYAVNVIYTASQK